MSQSNSQFLMREFCAKFFYHLLLKENKNLYQSIFIDQDLDTLIDEIKIFQESYEIPDDEHLEASLDLKTLSRSEELIKISVIDFLLIEETINKSLTKGRNIARLEEMDQAILIPAVWEILKAKTPFQIVINDYIKLAKKYSSEQSPRFINGLLDAIAKS